MIYLKRVASICFALAFLLALVLFTGYGSNYIPISLVKKLFIIVGGLGLFFNLLSFQTGKHNPLFSLIYWIGSTVLFVGLVFMMLHYPYAYVLIIGGMVILGISFFIPSVRSKNNPKNEDLLDS